MTKAKPYPKLENISSKVSESVCPTYETVSTYRENGESDIARAITGEELLNRLRPRIKALFDK